jgi:hypothetical protein
MLGGIARQWGFSRRRAFLITVGIGWALYGGLGILGDPRYGTARGLSGITQYVSLSTLGWMWVILGATAALAGLAINCPRVQALGYASLAAPAGLWAGVFAAAAATSFPSAIGSACGWGAFTIGVVLVSGMDDPPPPQFRKKAR